MKTIFALLAFSEGNTPVTCGFHSQRPVRRSFDVLFDLRLKKWMSKQPRRRWFETPSRQLWRHCNGKGWIIDRNDILLTWIPGDGTCLSFHTLDDLYSRSTASHSWNGNISHLPSFIFQIWSELWYNCMESTCDCNQKLISSANSFWKRYAAFARARVRVHRISSRKWWYLLWCPSSD